MGLATKVDHYDRVFNNTIAIYDSLRDVNEVFFPAAAFRPHASGGVKVRHVRGRGGLSGVARDASTRTANGVARSPGYSMHS